jgi:hypothetical protein
VGPSFSGRSIDRERQDALALVSNEIHQLVAAGTCKETEIGVRMAGRDPIDTSFRDHGGFRRLGGKLAILDIGGTIRQSERPDGFNGHHASNPLSKAYAGLTKLYTKLANLGYRDDDIRELLTRADRRPVTSLDQLEHDILAEAERVDLPRHEKALPLVLTDNVERRQLANECALQFISGLNLNNERWLADRDVPPTVHRAIGALTFGIAMEKVGQDIRSREVSTSMGLGFIPTMVALAEAQQVVIAEYSALRDSGMDEQQIEQAFQAKAQGVIGGLDLASHVTWRLDALIDPPPTRAEAPEPTPQP